MSAPPPVPALPDAERRTSYAITAQTGPFAVNFELYGDASDYGDWITVWLNETLLNAGVDYVLTSPTGTIGMIPLPIIDAVINLTVASTGTLQIIGARRPRRVTQFAENRGVAARDLNQAFSDIVAQEREAWDLIRSRVPLAPGGDFLTMLPVASTRANKLFAFDGSGNPEMLAVTISGSMGITALSVTRSLFSTVTMPANTVMLSGYYTAGDLGVGAIYTSVGAGPSGPQAIQDLSGTWFNLVVNAVTNVGWWGAKGDGATNDSTAFQGAFNSNATEIWVPNVAINYQVQNLTLPAGKTLRGFGRQAVYNPLTVAALNGSCCLAMIAAGGTGLINFGNNCVCMDINLCGTNSTVYGLGSGTKNGLRFTRVGLYFFNGAIASSGAYINVCIFLNCSVSTNTTGVQNLIDSHVIDCVINYNSGNGVNQQAGANDTAFVGNKVEWNGLYNWQFFNCVNNNVVGGVCDRSQTDYGVKTQGSDLTFTGVVFKRNGALNNTSSAHVEVEGTGTLTIVGCQSEIGANDDSSGNTTPTNFLHVGGTGGTTVIIAGSNCAGYTSPTFPINYSASGVNFIRVYGSTGLPSSSHHEYATTDCGTIAQSGGTSSTVITGLYPTIETANVYFPMAMYRLYVQGRDPATGNLYLNIFIIQVARPLSGGASATIIATIPSATGINTSGALINVTVGSVTTDGSGFTITLTNTYATNGLQAIWRLVSDP